MPSLPSNKDLQLVTCRGPEGRIQAGHGIPDVSRELTEALEWDVTSSLPRSDPSGTLSRCQGIVADIIR